MPEYPEIIELKYDRGEVNGMPTREVLTYIPEIAHEAEIARLTAALDEAKLGLELALAIPDNEYALSATRGCIGATLDRISTIERGSDE